MKKLNTLKTCIALSVVASVPSLAIAQAGESDGGAQDRIDLATWEQSELYSGWSADKMLGTEVFGKNGDSLGDIKNIVVTPEGTIESVIVEAGGFLDIGDTHFKVKWDEVEVGENLDWVAVPVDEENFDEFNLFGDSEGYPDAGPRNWRVTELTDDYVALQDNRSYGYVDDIVFSNQGEIQAVIVSPDLSMDSTMYGYRAYPYYGYGNGNEPGNDYYNLPYGVADITELAPFDVRMLERHGNMSVN